MEAAETLSVLGEKLEDVPRPRGRCGSWFRVLLAWLKACLVMVELVGDVISVLWVAYVFCFPS